MPKIPIIKAKDFLKHLYKYGCVLVGIKGSHHKIANPLNGHTSIVPIHSSKDLPQSLFAKILSDLEIDAIEFLKFIEKK